MESTVRLVILTACMLLTGSVNTIATKYQVNKGCSSCLVLPKTSIGQAASHGLRACFRIRQLSTAMQAAYTRRTSHQLGIHEREKSLHSSIQQCRVHSCSWGRLCASYPTFFCAGGNSGDTKLNVALPMSAAVPAVADGNDAYASWLHLLCQLCVMQQLPHCSMLGYTTRKLDMLTSTLPALIGHSTRVIWSNAVMLPPSRCCGVHWFSGQDF